MEVCAFILESYRKYIFTTCTLPMVPQEWGLGGMVNSPSPAGLFSFKFELPWSPWQGGGAGPQEQGASGAAALKWSEVKVALSCPTLCNPMDCSPRNSPGQNTGVGSLSLLQRDLSDPGIQAGSPALQADSFPAELSRKPIAGLGADNPPCLPFAPVRPSCYCARPQPQLHGLSCEIGFSPIVLPACQEVRKSAKTSGAKKLPKVSLCQ